MHTKRMSEYVLARLVGIVGVASAAACTSTSYMFRPTENVTATTEGYPTARYSIPPESPRGTVYVTSFGVVHGDMVGDGQNVPLLQVRLTVENNSGDDTWTVDPREQLLDIPGAGQSRPALVNSERQDAPAITVPVGTKRTLDFYYVLPPNRSSASDVPSFDLLWQVQTGQRLVAERTPFEKERIEPTPPNVYATVGFGPGWGPYWWYDPFYPELAFRPAPLVIHRRFPGIMRHPHPWMTARPGPGWGRGPGPRRR